MENSMSDKIKRKKQLDDINIDEELDSSVDIVNAHGVCPKCGSPLKEKWSGVECTKCDYWFCF